MTKKEFLKIYRELEKARYELFYNEGISFDMCVMIRGGERYHTSVGFVKEYSDDREKALEKLAATSQEQDEIGENEQE